jgi:hypothetical protein
MEAGSVEEFADLHFHLTVFFEDVCLNELALLKMRMRLDKPAQ